MCLVMQNVVDIKKSLKITLRGLESILWKPKMFYCMLDNKFLPLFFQDVMVSNDPEKGVLITGQSLVLQRVDRRRAGRYACVASNLEGDTQSNEIELKIKCEELLLA